MKFLTPAEQEGILKILEGFLFVPATDDVPEAVKAAIIAYIADYTDFKVNCDWYTPDRYTLEFICWFESNSRLALQPDITYNFTVGNKV